MNKRHLFSLLALALLPGAAFAHAGHDGNGLIAGLLHPFTGADHLLAMLAIGIWAALQPRAMQIAVPATFLTALLAGFAMGVAGTGLPLLETGIALSVLLLGLLLASAIRLPAFVSLALAGFFAIFHGYAHGAEASGSVIAFASGFLAASLALHVTGGLLTTTLRQRLPLLARGAGALIAASGALMMV
ncbi:HupE/UreJ family protein [Azomonas macrocytogenes]|uniref:Urease accessory protein n=1 Tax=Azomonas macrocytogenes TaxID=69962 RepID=A0A839T8N9_AZOMA|nr:HupE/UreJ family protein [Azomonas macrocytogenes]MBB3104826.1 urease accessory protein [Azomonas macrocytogenes]